MVLLIYVGLFQKEKKKVGDGISKTMFKSLVFEFR